MIQTTNNNTTSNRKNKKASIYFYSSFSNQLSNPFNSKSVRSSKQIASRSKWTKEEEESLIRLVSITGAKGWNQIASLLKTKTAKQCRDHYANCLDPEIKTSLWTVEEEKILMSKFCEYGSQWSKIKRFLPGRTNSMIKNYVSMLLKKKEFNVSNQQYDMNLVNQKNEICLYNEKNDACLSNQKNEIILINQQNDVYLSNQQNEIYLSNKKNDACSSGYKNEMCGFVAQNDESSCSNNNTSSDADDLSMELNVDGSNRFNYHDIKSLLN